MEITDIATLAMNSKTGTAADAERADAVIEPKYDGIRLLIHITEDGCRSYARSGKSKTGKLPSIEAELAAALPAGTWLDGEAVGFNEDGTQNWGAAQSVLGSDASKVIDRSGIDLVVFDLIAHGGMDARSLPMAQRRELLEMIFAQHNFENVVLSEQVPASPEAHEENLARGYEGSMVKIKSAPYASGKRSPASLKLKATDTIDCVVTGAEPGAPDSWIARAGLIGKLTFKFYEDGREIEGKCSGMTVAEREAFTKAHAEGVLVNAVIEVSYMTRMPGTGKLRHPQFKRVRTDKTAEECKA